MSDTAFVAILLAQLPFACLGYWYAIHRLHGYVLVPFSETKHGVK